MININPNRWYVVPKYTAPGRTTPDPSVEVRSRRGELVAVFEDEADAEDAVARHNEGLHAYTSEPDTDLYGVPYVDDDGTLEPWAEYVATSPLGHAEQFESKPYSDFTWLHFPSSEARVAPVRYAITDLPWTETLRRVRRPSR